MAQKKFRIKLTVQVFDEAGVQTEDSIKQDVRKHLNGLIVEPGAEITVTSIACKELNAGAKDE